MYVYALLVNIIIIIKSLKQKRERENEIGEERGRGEGGRGWRVNDVYRIGNVYRNYQKV